MSPHFFAANRSLNHCAVALSPEALAPVRAVEVQTTVLARLWTLHVVVRAAVLSATQAMRRTRLLCTARTLVLMVAQAGHVCCASVHSFMHFGLDTARA
jgi:hypothetical protein